MEKVKNGENPKRNKHKKQFVPTNAVVLWGVILAVAICFLMVGLFGNINSFAYWLAAICQWLPDAFKYFVMVSPLFWAGLSLLIGFLRRVHYKKTIEGTHGDIGREKKSEKIGEMFVKAGVAALMLQFGVVATTVAVYLFDVLYL